MSEPKFIQPMTPAKEEIIEYSGARFTGKVSGEPFPSVKWFKNDEVFDVKPDRHSKVSCQVDEATGSVVITFKETTREDDGTYKCFLKNANGTAASAFDLIIEFDPNA